MGLMVTESEKSKHDMLRAMRKHIRENGITDFTDFQDWCDENNDCWSLALDSGLVWKMANLTDTIRKIQKSQIGTGTYGMITIVGVIL